MSMNDPIADMLTRIRNGLTAGHSVVDVPASRLKEEICAVLKHEGYIRDFRAMDVEAKPHLRIELKYLPDRSSVIQGLRRVSKPSLRRYVGWREIPPVRSGLGIAVISTSKGVMAGKQARSERLGGEVVCEVW
ncbi:MAG TPA: 30S ribosomal protein S8 [Candidatus Hydrogenedentes bacterium]|nr:30S ribosomal protein S8 [Candidatus Hydrogenedentota bacterium]